LYKKVENSVAGLNF